MSTEKDNPISERDPLLERFQEACSSITPVVREKDPLFAEFIERFLWLFYYSGYRQVTWMIEACPDPDLLRSLFRYHWDNNLDDLPSGEVLMGAMKLTFHDELDLPRETVTDHIEQCFRDAMEELRAREHSKVTQKKMDVVRFPSPPDLCWEEVSIAFVSDTEIKVRARDQIKKYRFDHIGFKNKKNGKPNILWWLLRVLAEKGGELSWDNSGNYESPLNPNQVQSNVKRLRKILRNFMGIEDDPFEPYNQVKAYQTRFATTGAADALLDFEEDAPPPE